MKVFKITELFLVTWKYFKVRETLIFLRSSNLFLQIACKFYWCRGQIRQKSFLDSHFSSAANKSTTFKYNQIDFYIKYMFLEGMQRKLPLLWTFSIISKKAGKGKAQ